MEGKTRISRWLHAVLQPVRVRMASTEDGIVNGWMGPRSFHSGQAPPAPLGPHRVAVDGLAIGLLCPVSWLHATVATSTGLLPPTAGTADAMPTALTLADVFNAEAAEAPYQRLVAVLNRQETLLARLSERLDALQASQETAARSTRELEEQTIAALADRVSALENETKREREALADDCRAQIQALESALQLKCDRRALTDAAERAERATLKLGLEVDNPFLSELMKSKVLNSVWCAADRSGPRPRASSWSTACRRTRTCCTSVSGPSTGGSMARSTRWRATGLPARCADEH